jgi:uncharacterized protein YqiB (DUF1249 family)
MWSKFLRLQIVEARKYTRNIQARIRKTNAPVARIKYALDADNFDQLLKLLGESRANV